MFYNNKKIAFINKSSKQIKFDFDCDKIKNDDIDIKNINKSSLTEDYDFILIYDKKNKTGVKNGKN